MEKILSTIHEDLKSLLADWHLVCKNHALLEKSDFLNKVRNHILLLDTHTEDLKSNRSIHDLIHHILHTPPGAPAAFQGTLLDCAKDEQNSALHEYLQKTLSSSDEKSNFLFNSLSILDDRL
jgi:hypothetical protein